MRCRNQHRPSPGDLSRGYANHLTPPTSVDQGSVVGRQPDARRGHYERGSESADPRYFTGGAARRDRGGPSEVCALEPAKVSDKTLHVVLDAKPGIDPALPNEH
jgi:hypothetical protein